MGIRRSLTRTLSKGLGVLLSKKLASLDAHAERQLVNIEPIIKKDDDSTNDSIEGEGNLTSIPNSHAPPAVEKREAIEHKPQSLTEDETNDQREQSRIRKLAAGLGIENWRSLKTGGPDYNEIEEVSRWSSRSKTTDTSSIKSGSSRTKAQGLGINTWRSLKTTGPDYNEIEAVSRGRQDSVTERSEQVIYEAHLAQNRKFFAGTPLWQILDTEAERNARVDPLFERLLMDAKELNSDRNFAQIQAFWDDVRSQLSLDQEELDWPEGYPDHRAPSPDVIEDYLESRYQIPIDQNFS